MSDGWREETRPADAAIKTHAVSGKTSSVTLLNGAQVGSGGNAIIATGDADTIVRVRNGAQLNGVVTAGAGEDMLVAETGGSALVVNPVGIEELVAKSGGTPTGSSGTYTFGGIGGRIVVSGQPVGDFASATLDINVEGVNIDDCGSATCSEAFPKKYDWGNSNHTGALGVVSFADRTARTISVGTITGSYGVINIDADFAKGESDILEISGDVFGKTYINVSIIEQELYVSQTFARFATVAAGEGSLRRWQVHCLRARGRPGFQYQLHHRHQRVPDQAGEDIRLLRSRRRH